MSQGSSCERRPACSGQPRETGLQRAGCRPSASRSMSRRFKDTKLLGDFWGPVSEKEKQLCGRPVGGKPVSGPQRHLQG